MARMNRPQVYEYMKHENDEIEIDEADLKRKHSSPNILIGSARRVHSFLYLVLSWKDW